MDNKKSNNRILVIAIVVVAVLILIFVGIIIYANSLPSTEDEVSTEVEQLSEDELRAEQQKNAQAKIDEAYSKLTLKTDFRKSLTHGPKTAAYQKYIVLHDTEGDGRAENVVSG